MLGLTWRGMAPACLPACLRACLPAATYERAHVLCLCAQFRVLFINVVALLWTTFMLLRAKRMAQAKAL